VTGSTIASAPLAQAVRPAFEADWIGGNVDRLVAATQEHLYLTGLGVGTGFVVSLVLSILALRWRASYAPILSLGGVLYTIPSLAAFALLVPFFQFSVTTAVIPLATYTVLILVKNIVDGIDGVPNEVEEAALGMGYRPTRMFLTIQLPLALPVIIAGLRVATVTVIGLVTVTALVGSGGLGQLILQGFRVTPPFPTQILVGTFLSVVLAIALDLLLLGAERALTPWARRRATA
jgi:osmoprotectant transport system permease protein